MTTLFLFLLRLTKYPDHFFSKSSGLNGPVFLLVSPVGLSILMTSAPWSASIIVQYGPESILLKSNTFKPERIPFFILLFFYI